MAFKTLCPACGQTLKIDDNMVGAAVRCPKCAHRFTVASLRNAGAETLDTAAAATLTQLSETAGGKPGSDRISSTRSTGSGKSSRSRVRSQPSIGQFGRFELKRALGQGGFGAVYLAYDPVLDRSVALKIPKFTPDDERLIERFVREGKAAANLHHPNIVAVFESGRAGDNYYIASEFVAGRPLSDVIKERKEPIPLPQAAVWVRDLARALGYAHDEGIIHRDIKPQNIMLDEHDRPRILDFGLAKRLDEDATMTTDGSLLGTPAYMAPEQARGETKAVGPRSDQYSLGVVLYELITGTKPFDGPPHTVLAKVDREEPPAAKSLRPDLTRDLAAVCEKVMEKDPAKRYESADAFANDLDLWLNDRPTAARPITRADRALRWCRRNPVVAGAFATVALALVAIAAVSALYADRQRHFAIEEAKANQRISKLADDLTISLEQSNSRLAAQQLQRGLSAIERGELGPGLLWMVQSLRSATAAGDARGQRAARANLAAWNREYPSLLAVFSHSRPIIAVAISPDGKTVATGSEDRTARLWNLTHGAPIGAPLEHPGIVFALCFSPDGKRLATGSVKVVRLWDATSAKLIGSLPFPELVTAVAYDARGARLFACGDHGSSQVWDAASEKTLGSLSERSGGISVMALSPDGKTILTGSRENEVRLHDAGTLRMIGSPIKIGAGIWAGTFSPDGKQFLLGAGGRGELWDVATRSRVGRQMAHAGRAHVVSFSPDGKTILTGSNDKTARLWNAATQTPIGQVYRQEGPIEGGAISPDGKTFVTAGGDYTARAWAIGTERGPGVTVGHPDVIGCVAFRPDGKVFFTASSDRTVQAWDSATGRPVGEPLTHPAAVGTVSISPDGKTALTGCVDHFARVWDLSSGQLSGEPMQHQAEVTVAAISPNGQILLTGGQDQVARLWDATTRKPLVKPLLAGGQVDAGAFSPDGKTVAIGTSEGVVQFWDVATGAENVRSISHHGAVSAVAFSPDGKTLVVAGEDSTAQLWDLATRSPAAPPLQHKGWVFGAAFSPDGKTILTGSQDTTARLWDAATSVPIGPAFPLPSLPSTVAFSPDGKMILTGCFDHKARLLPIVGDRSESLETLGPWVEAFTGLSLDSYESVQVLDNETLAITPRPGEKLAIMQQVTPSLVLLTGISACRRLTSLVAAGNLVTAGNFQSVVISPMHYTKTEARPESLK